MMATTEVNPLTNTCLPFSFVINVINAACFLHALIIFDMEKNVPLGNSQENFSGEANNIYRHRYKVRSLLLFLELTEDNVV
jgi:hypothetical protein